MTASAELSARMGFLGRMETGLANGYLGPVMNSFKEGFGFDGFGGGEWGHSRSFVFDEWGEFAGGGGV